MYCMECGGDLSLVIQGESECEVFECNDCQKRFEFNCPEVDIFGEDLEPQIFDPAAERSYFKGFEIGRKIDDELLPNLAKAKENLADYVVNHAPWIIEVVRTAAGKESE